MNSKSGGAFVHFGARFHFSRNIPQVAEIVLYHQHKPLDPLSMSYKLSDSIRSLKQGTTSIWRKSPKTSRTTSRNTWQMDSHNVLLLKGWCCSIYSRQSCEKGGPGPKSGQNWSALQIDAAWWSLLRAQYHYWWQGKRCSSSESAKG